MVSRCEGEVRKYLTPYLWEDLKDPFYDLDNILKHLEIVFINLNKAYNTRHLYYNLTMTPRTKFYKFISEFYYLAVKLGTDKVF